MSKIVNTFQKQKSRYFSFFKWILISGIIGIVVGLVGTLFSKGLEFVTQTRMDNPLIIFGLPFGGLLIVYLYKKAGRGNDQGTNSIIAAVRSEDEVSILTAPLIFVGTLITHLFGGSVGREGAALQMGGSIGSGIGKVFKLNETDMHVAVMCGMSACFAALFGTPIAATFFAMEVVSVGVMYYAALVPCVFSSLMAVEIARFFGIKGEEMTIALIPEFTAVNTGKVALISIFCAALSIAFCVLMHETGKLTKKWLPNPYIRIFLMGFVFVFINLALNTQDYLGAGMHIIEHAVEHGQTNPETFLIKMLLTALTLGVGFKGGEIVPSFYVGATFGCLMGQVLGVSPSMCAAVGMIALFCGVTNSPITSLLLAIELFGMEGIYFVLIGVAISYMMSGYYSLYNSQRIMYSKYDAQYRGHKWSK